MMRFDPRINYLKKINLNKVKISKFIWTTNMPKWHKNENFKKLCFSKKTWWRRIANLQPRNRYVYFFIWRS